VYIPIVGMYQQLECTTYNHKLLFFLDFLILEYGTDRFFRNVGKEFP